MGMVFCRGCGKEIHETAPSCPHCGAPQRFANVSGGVAALAAPAPAHWASITALITGIVVFLLAGLTEADGGWTQDAIAGVVVLGCVPIIFGIVSLSKKQGGRWMAITGMVLGILMLLAAIGSR